MDVTPFEIIWFCGEEKFGVTLKTDEYGEHQGFWLRGLPEGRKFFTEGGVLDVGADGQIGPYQFSGTEVRRLNSAMQPSCIQTPSAPDRIEWLQLSSTDASIAVLEPEGFERDGDIVTFWERALPVHTAAVETRLRSNEWEPDTIPAPDATRGETMRRWKVECTKGRIALANFIEYNADGSVARSANAREYELHWTVVVPGSVGAGVRSLVCSIR